MKKLLLSISPLLILLFLFSCAKDNEFPTPKEDVGISQALERTDNGRDCNIPCKKPDFLHVSQITGCSAVIDWGFEVPICGTFVVQLQNLTTGNWTYYNPAVSPLTLSGLDPCTKYTVGVSHVTNLCATVPLRVSFKTDCRKCESDCSIPCEQPDFLYAQDITTTGATIIFGHNTHTCGHFVAQLRNNSTGVYTYYDPVSSPLVLGTLDPCTSYTIGISHVTDLQACVPSQITFTTECVVDYCDASGDDPSLIYIQYITLDMDEPGIWSADPSTGYVDKTSEVLHLDPGQVLPYTATGTCFNGTWTGPIYYKLWIDYGNDGSFDASDLAYSISKPANGVGSLYCVDIPMPGFTFPNISVCGLTARFIVSLDSSAGPCGTFDVGQVMDFTINSAECSGD